MISPALESRLPTEDRASRLPHYPAPTALAEEFVELGLFIGEQLMQVKDDVLKQTFEPQFPDGKDRTFAEALPFLISHEALHVGQISYIRRLREMPGIATVAIAMMQAGG